MLCAFDLIELDGCDLRGEPIEERKAELARLLADGPPNIVFNPVFGDPGPIIFEHACKFGCEGIVSKRRGSRYAGGWCHDWLKVKNPDAPAPASRSMLSFKPCFPEAAHTPPISPDWLHEIKHDGYRMLARRDRERIHLISRRGLDWAWRFPMIVAAVEALTVLSTCSPGGHR
jgi:ATP-dependent DNA ligase